MQSKSKSYCGIGSRETPNDICDLMTGFASLAEELGWKLRSGGAEGADLAFEKGVIKGTNKEIYLPWGSFNGSKSMLFPPSAEAMKMAEQFHPNWAACSPGARKLHARNAHQVMGQHLTNPVQFILCWTKDGKDIGGTALAIRIAKAHGISVFNMGGEIDEDQLEYILRDKAPSFLKK
ncbi:hypothetical protein Ab1vBOLIVR2_gp33 [Agrobacterium phage OLIVR2]|uniref:DNA recombination-mediator protein A n=1 Tax=Agrobacterium phage OLIVR1 TaxID=2723769 RepID=A0A858MRQ9_9CAUD|nr:hypothetical protein [Xanthomonas campestris]YP_010107067.1 DprA-like DNA recombination-mediator protein [Agrobacterium phage OLIVR1]QIW87336.1 hypothetical protein Ab1vBOLIVR2_gp33 [Agrobacterium phage OLIVR2]QIW87443.1 hypothetical protein Ab1vBOLIVR3_gp33 [Agrobacterium phage OLIVR3]MCF8861627.1 hypothetical protein [Xanthomonas campestris pv. campestris]QIW87228.1 hypothetical protein Ab1vBOLIVR1_gp33 [Agrobacterium phage OLIVR1]